MKQMRIPKSPRITSVLTFMMLFCAFSFIVFSCYSCTTKDEEAVETDVKSFVCSYFNFRYADALKRCTPESEKWIRFQASNITQNDLDVFNNQTDTASCEIDNIKMSDDTTAVAYVNVKNFLSADSIGRPGVMCGNAQFVFGMRKRNDRWLVNLNSVPTRIK